MGKTYSTIVDDVETILQDAGLDPGGVANSTYNATEIQALLPDSLAFVSRHKPWEYKLTKAIASTAREISLSNGDKWRLIKVLKAEYPVDQDPRKFRNVDRFADELTVRLDYDMESGEDLYLFLYKTHLLQSAIGTADTAGAVKTAGSEGDTTLALKGLGTGTINEMTTIAITGDSTIYYVISTATIAGNEATVSIWPPLAADVLADAVVTLTLTDSTMDPDTENCFARYLAARMAISKATKLYAQPNAAIAQCTLAAAAIASVGAYITQARSDITSGRTESAKISAILDTANAEIDKILALLTQMATDLGSGRTEGAKIAAIIGTCQTAISGVATILTQSRTDIASARTSITAGGTAITEADAEFDLINPRIDQAVTDLSNARSLLNAVTSGGGAPEGMSQAASEVGVANGYATSGQVYLQKASADFAQSAQLLGAAAREVDNGIGKLNEAKASLEQATAEGMDARVYIDIVIGGLRIVQGYAQEAQSYVLEANTRMANNLGFLQDAAAEMKAVESKINEGIASIRLVQSRISISNAGIALENWGRRELAMVTNELLSLGGYPTSDRYSRS